MTRIFHLFFMLSYVCFSQKTNITFYPVDARTFNPIDQLQVQLPDTLITSKANNNGHHIILAPRGKYDLIFMAESYYTITIPVSIGEEDSDIRFAQISFYLKNVEEETPIELISLTLDELDTDFDESETSATLLQTSKDVFLQTAAYNFSGSFFRLRGLESSHHRLLLNDIEMNKLHTGRPQWSNWGGLNDVMRNQTFTQSMHPLSSHFGGLIGSTNISTQASNFRKRSRVTYSFSNRSYQNRALISHSSGMRENGWGYVTALGFRRGLSGFQESTFYDAFSLMLSMDKIINSLHTLNGTVIYTPVRRGKGSSHTQEVADLKGGSSYNAYWGWQNGKKRNARIARIAEPIFMLSHFWKPKPTVNIQTVASYQFGQVGNSRIDYPGGTNPAPTYYQKLPSYFLSGSNGPDYEKAYLAREEFNQNGQIDWHNMYAANQTKLLIGKPSAYALYEDRKDDRQFALSSSFEQQLNSTQSVSMALRYRLLQSTNFASPIDLLGGLGLENIDSYDGYAFDLDGTNTPIEVGDKYRYHYVLFASSLGVHPRFSIDTRQIQAYGAAELTQTTYQREGVFRNGAFPTTSKGKSKRLSFPGIGVKTGLKTHIVGRHWMDANIAYTKRPPTLRNSFSNPRENNDVVGEFTDTPLRMEKIFSSELSYIFRTPSIDVRLTTYSVLERDVTKVSFFFADGIEGDSSAFLQEVVQGIEKNHIGLEWGMEAKLLSVLTLKSVAALGRHTYTKNPLVYATSEDFEEGSINFGKSQLTNTYLAVGPHNAFALGLEYQDPNFWRLSATYSYYTNTYLGISPILRTQNFLLDDDGLPFVEYDPEKAKMILIQERFADYGLLNLTANKSWKIEDMYLGWFLSINNILGTSYKTGGYEQSRSANYRSLLEDYEAPMRRFGPKYWYGRGTTFFMNLSLRF